MTPSLLRQYASSTAQAHHSVTFTATPGRSIFAAAFAPTAHGTLGNGVIRHEPWEIAHSVEFTNQELRLWRCPRERNDGSVSSLEVQFDAAQSMCAVIWEDDVDEVVFYANVRGYTPSTSDNPFVAYTRGNDVPAMAEGFALYALWGAASGPCTAQLVSFDGGYSAFADSGPTLAPYSGDFPSRIVMAHKAPSPLFANTGVNGTANGTMAAKNVVDTMAGLISYEVLTHAPPINLTAPSLAGVAETGEVIACLRGIWRNGPESYAFQWRRNGSPIAGETASAYLLTIADEFADITCRVSSTNIYGTASVDSGILVPAPPPVIGDTFINEGDGWHPVSTRVLSPSGWEGADT